MNLPERVMILSSIALLAACGGGGGSGTTPPSTASSSSSATAAANVGTGFAIKVATGTTKSSSTRRSVKQITTDVTTLVVQVDGVSTNYELSPALSPACTGSSPNYTCTIAASAGTHNVNVYTQNGSAAYVGFGFPQDNVTISLGQVTPLNFTLTPVVSALAGGTEVPAPSYSLPEDGANHPVTVEMDALAPNGQLISSPIDTENYFGAVAVTTTPSYPVTQAPQAPASTLAGVYADAPYQFTYDGSQIPGDQLVVNGAYTQNHNDTVVTDQIANENAYNGEVTASASAVPIFNIPLTRLTLPPNPSPANATIGGTTFDPTNSWYYYPPNNGSTPTVPQPNGSSSAVLVFNDGATSSVSLTMTETNDTNPMTVSGTCVTPLSGTPWTPYTTTGSPNGMMTLQILPPAVSGQTAPCVITIVDGAFSTVTQSLNIYPNPGSYAITTQSVHRR